VVVVVGGGGGQTTVHALEREGATK